MHKSCTVYAPDLESISAKQHKNIQHFYLKLEQLLTIKLTKSEKIEKRNNSKTLSDFLTILHKNNNTSNNFWLFVPLFSFSEITFRIERNLFSGGSIMEVLKKGLEKLFQLLQFVLILSLFQWLLPHLLPLFSSSSSPLNRSHISAKRVHNNWHLLSSIGYGIMLWSTSHPFFSSNYLYMTRGVPSLLSSSHPDEVTWVKQTFNPEKRYSVERNKEVRIVTRRRWGVKLDMRQSEDTAMRGMER